MLRKPEKWEVKVESVKNASMGPERNAPETIACADRVFEVTMLQWGRSGMLRKPAPAGFRGPFVFCASMGPERNAPENY